MKMRKPCLWLVLAVVLVMTAVLVGCPKKAAPPPDTTTLPTPAPGPEADQPEAVEPETSESGPGDVVLTKELVDQWIACANDEKIRKIVEDLRGGTRADDPGSMRDMIEGMAAGAEFEEAVKSHGFESAAEWAAVTVKVMAGFQSASMAKAREQMGQMGDAPGLDEAKAKMEKQMAAGEKAFGGLTEDEKQVIDDSLDEIKAALKGDDGSSESVAE
jgi:hypothetical protein